MFQSFWNMAAAYCLHEEPIQSQQTYHFGHHQNNLCVSDNQQIESDKNTTELDTTSNLKFTDDHHDHVPSMTHLYIEDAKVEMCLALSEVEMIHDFYWINGYQPPDLFQQNPPPVFAPLMVG